VIGTESLILYFAKYSVMSFGGVGDRSSWRPVAMMPWRVVLTAL
jgi:hypothetical protein